MNNTEPAPTVENLHLQKENSSLRKQFLILIAKSSHPEFEDLLAALTISDFQRERINFLLKELDYVESRKKALLEEEQKSQRIVSLQNQGDLEPRLEAARHQKKQIEMELENLERKRNRELCEMKKNSARQDARILTNL